VSGLTPGPRGCAIAIAETETDASARSLLRHPERLNGWQRSMNEMKRTFCAVLITLSCAASVASLAAGLAGSEWRPSELDGTAIASDTGMFVQFGGDGRLEGNGGCNRFFGTYTQTAGSIRIDPLAATQSTCDRATMEHEARLLSALARARRVVRERWVMTLEDGAAQTIARFVQTDAD